MEETKLMSISNFRDLAGLQGRGGRIRPGCLLRSANLGRATEEDISLLRDRYRLRTVIDLRTPGETTKWPDHAPEVTVLCMPILGELKAGITHEKDDEMPPLPDMAYLYREMMNGEASKRAFAAVLRRIMAEDFDRGAVLWHCTEGKDRCGMTAALVLEALGVSRADILADYLKTNAWSLDRARLKGEKAAALYGERYGRSVYEAYVADERYIEAAWDAMGEAYLTEELGLTEAELEAFRARVLA